MMECVSKSKQRVIFLADDNWEEILKEDYPNYKDEYITVEVKDNAVIVKAHDLAHASKIYKFGYWVEEYRDYEYPEWVHYTEEEFEENYVIVGCLRSHS